MSRILLISNAEHDNATEYLSSWFEKVVEIAKKQTDIKIVELSKEHSNKKEVAEMIEKENPRLIIFNGHGSYDAIGGFKQEILIKCDDNESLLVGKIIHSMACRCAKELGPKCIKLGTHCFIGYKENFELWTMSQTTKESQLQDEMASLFLEPAYEAIIALIEGKTTGEAYHRSQSMYRDNILALVTSKNKDHNSIVATSLYNNLNNQVCLGNQLSCF